MLARNDWVVPMFNGQLRTHKPILLYWLQMPAMAIFGQTEFAARCGSAAMASLAALAIFFFLRWHSTASHAFWSATALASSLMFVVAGRAATPDAALIATSTLGILGVALHCQRSTGAWTRWSTLGYGALGFAVLAKGPVGFVLPMIVVGSWQFLEQLPPIDAATSRTSVFAWKSMLAAGWQALRRTLQRLHVVAGIAIVLSVAAPWYLWVGLRTDGAWLQGFFLDHNLGRAMSAMEGHSGGWWFYPLACLVGLFPWSMLLIPIAGWTGSHWSGRPCSPWTRLGALWLGTYILMFSLAQTKLPSYITPGYPGAAILIGGMLADWRSGRERLTRAWQLFGAAVFVGVGLVIGLAIAYLATQSNLPALRYQGCWGAGFLLIGLLFAIGYFDRVPAMMPPLILVSALIFAGGIFGVASSAVDRHRRDLNAMLALPATDEGVEIPAKAWRSLRAIEPSWVYYLGQPIEEWPGMLPPSDSDLADKSTRLDTMAQFLQKPGHRLLLDAEQWEAWREYLDRKYGLSLRQVGQIPLFLKEQVVLVVEAVQDQPAAKVARGQP
jgi:4-amino-4-deoxy-L-arabinose transferase-like glycosyltransferase